VTEGEKLDGELVSPRGRPFDPRAANQTVDQPVRGCPVDAKPFGDFSHRERPSGVDQDLDRRHGSFD
jgi:hypothetical protein